MQKWKAIYTDGSELPQFNEDGTENKYKDINRSKLSKFVLLVDKNPKIVVHLDSNKKLIYRRRVAIRMVGNLKNQEAVYLVGWQENKNGINTQMICFLFEDGHVEVVDRFYENHPWLYSVNFLEVEK